MKPQLRFPGFQEEWEEKKLGEVASCTIGLVTTMTKNYVENGKGVSLINLNTVFANNNKHRMLKQNDIITVHTGDIGTSAIITEEYDNSLSFAGLQTRLNNCRDYYPLYFSWYFNSSIAKRYFINMSTGDGRTNLNLKDFKRLKVAIPSLPEQKKIAEFLSKQDELIEKEEEKLSLLKEQKKGLLQQMFV